jgi:transposase
MNFLTEQERAQLKLQHKQERDKRVCDRIKAILLYDDGWSPQQIAKVLLISDQAVRDHVDEYKALHKLKPENGGSEEKLSKQQSKELEAHLQEHTYLYTKDIIAYAQITFGITYTVPGLNKRLLKVS